MCLMYWNSYVFSSDLAAGVRRDLLDAVVAAAARRRIDELEVVDDDQAQPVLTLQAPGPRAELRHRQRRGVVDEQLEAVQRLRDREDPVILLLPHVAAPYRVRSEEHTSELQSLMRISYAVFCLKKKKYNICNVD